MYSFILRQSPLLFQRDGVSVVIHGPHLVVNLMPAIRTDVENTIAIKNGFFSVLRAYPEIKDEREVVCAKQ